MTSLLAVLEVVCGRRIPPYFAILSFFFPLLFVLFIALFLFSVAIGGIFFRPPLPLFSFERPLGLESDGDNLCMRHFSAAISLFLRN